MSVIKIPMLYAGSKGEKMFYSLLIVKQICHVSILILPEPLKHQPT